MPNDNDDDDEILKKMSRRRKSTKCQSKTKASWCMEQRILFVYGMLA